jgi:hypothetical protein
VVGTRAFPQISRCERIDGSGPRVRIDGARLRLSFSDSTVQPCSVRVGDQVFKRLDGQTLWVRPPATVRIVPRGRCAVLWADSMGPLQFRLTS